MGEESSKTQDTNKFQTPSTRVQRDPQLQSANSGEVLEVEFTPGSRPFDAWDFGIGICLCLVSWGLLGFGFHSALDVPFLQLTMFGIEWQTTGRRDPVNEREAQGAGVQLFGLVGGVREGFRE